MRPGKIPSIVNKLTNYVRYIDHLVLELELKQLMEIFSGSEIYSKLVLAVLLAAPCLSDQSPEQNNKTIQAHREHRRR